MTKQKWTEELFNCQKPIIAMCHCNALPGDPYFDRKGGMKKIVDFMHKDLIALQNGGVDAVMFSNEFSLPYMTRVDTVTVAAMARVIGELMDNIRVPFGVNVLWDPIASLDLAAATGATFVREIFTGVYASDFGLWNTNCGATVRHKHAIGLPDALCVSGLTAGMQTDIQILKKVKDSVPDMIVFANTGVNLDNVEETLKFADGAVVGTTFKYDGVFENHIDEKRVKEFMDKVKANR
jgi:predicted TIM-barrel enzyme